MPFTNIQLSTDLLSEGVTLIELFSLTYARSIQPLLELVQPTLEEYQPSIEEVHPLLGQAVNMTLSVNFDKINNVLRPVFVGIPSELFIHRSEDAQCMETYIVLL